MKASADLETLGTTARSIIAAIGLAVFDIDGKIVGTFKRKVRIDNQVGRTFTQDTMLFWLSQSKEAIDLTFGEEAVNLDVALCELWDFIHKYKTDSFEIYGNPGKFDVAILEDAYQQSCLNVPWDHWQTGCMKELKKVSTNAWRTIPFEGVKHDCLADAIHQAKVIHMMRKEHAAPLEESDLCPFCEQGFMKFTSVDPDSECTCHLSPPCNHCITKVLRCDDCGWEGE